VIGLLALALIGVVGTIYLSKKYSGLLIAYRYELWGMVAFSTLVLGLFMSFMIAGKNKRVRKKLKEIALKVLRQGFFYNMVEGFGAVTKKRRYLIYAFLISIGAQGICLAGLLNLINLTDELTPDIFSLVAVSSMVLLLGVIPVTPGNIGWTELLATFGWSAIGSQSGAEVFLSWRIVTVICSLLGGIFYLFPVTNPRGVPTANDTGGKEIMFEGEGWVRDYLASHRTPKLHLGAGPNILEGWLNTDVEPQGEGVFFLDAGKPFPLPDQAFDYIFSEHLIEHFTYRDGLRVLKECYRVLKPGGTIRIATPDMDKIIGLRTKEKNDLQSRYVKWHIDNFFPEIGGSNDIFVINSAFSGFGHKFLYDEMTLRNSLRETGFSDIVRCAPGESHDVNLQKVDHRARDEMWSFSHLILEGKKPNP